MANTQREVGNVINKNIQEAIDGFICPNNGQAYVNGSLRRLPYYWYEVSGVKQDAWEGTKRDLRGMASDDQA